MTGSSPELTALTEQVAGLHAKHDVDEKRRTDADDKRLRLWRYIVVPLLVGILGGGGVTGWRLADGEIERKVQKLGERSIEQEVQMVEGIRFIGDKIDAAHPREAATVAKPRSLKAAEKRVDRIKRKKAVEQMFEGVPDLDDPLADEPE